MLPAPIFKYCKKSEMSSNDTGIGIAARLGLTLTIITSPSGKIYDAAARLYVWNMVLSVRFSTRRRRVPAAAQDSCRGDVCTSPRRDVVAAVNAYFCHGEDILQRFWKRCRISRRGEVEMSPWRVSRDW